MSLEAIPNTEEKNRSLNNRYSQFYGDFKRQERDFLVQKRKVEQANKEKDAGTYLSPSFLLFPVLFAFVLMIYH
jgi:hypothetical protein